MSVQVFPSSAAGTLLAPPSKSYTHRALVMASLAPGGARVLSPLVSDDTSASLRALRAMGGSASLEPSAEGGAHRTGTLEVRPIPRGTHPRDPVAIVEVGESGTTLRFFCAVAALGGRPVRFEGREGLARRPLGGLIEALDHLGAKHVGPPGGYSLPFTLHGPIRAGTVAVPGNVSSQFISALLLTLPTLSGSSELEVRGPRVSEPYIEATRQMMRIQGVEVDPHAAGYRIAGGQSYRGGEIPVPGDASTAAYFLALGALTGGPVKVLGLPKDEEWPQADLAVVEHLEQAGARIRRGPQDVEVARDAFPLRPLHVDLDRSPDLAPLLSVLASFSEGTSELIGGAHLAAKESDRRAGCLYLARALGARATDEGGRIQIRGPATARSLELLDLHDHRLLFSAAVAAAALPEPSHLGPRRSAAKSHPGFFEDLQALGVRCEERPPPSDPGSDPA